MEETPLIEQLKWNSEILALVIRSAFSAEGVNFVTSESSSLQLGVLKHPKGKKIKPHIHKEVIRTIKDTEEVLYMVYGKVEVQFYYDKKPAVSCVLSSGDTIVLLKGGHGFSVLEDSKIIEVKQGPFMSVAEDKERYAE